MTALVDAPAVVAAALDHMDHFPQVLAHVADPEVSGRAVQTHAPGIAQTESPQLRARPLNLEERIVLGHGIALARIGTIDVNPQDARAEVAQVLSGQIAVGIAGAVAGREVKAAIESEDQVAAVVAVRLPFEDELAGRGIAAARGLLGYGEAVDAIVL